MILTYTLLLMVCSFIISIGFLLTCWSVLDPVFKRGYLNTAWEQIYLDLGMKKFKAWVSLDLFTAEFFLLRNLIPFSFWFIKPSMKLHWRNHCRVPVPRIHVRYIQYCVLLYINWCNSTSPSVYRLLDRGYDPEKADEERQATWFRAGFTE